MPVQALFVSRNISGNVSVTSFTVQYLIQAASLALLKVVNTALMKVHNFSCE